MRQTLRRSKLVLVVHHSLSNPAEGIPILMERDRRKHLRTRTLRRKIRRVNNRPHQIKITMIQRMHQTVRPQHLLELFDHLNSPINHKKNLGGQNVPQPATNNGSSKTNNTDQSPQPSTGDASPNTGNRPSGQNGSQGGADGLNTVPKTGNNGGSSDNGGGGGGGGGSGRTQANPPQSSTPSPNQGGNSPQQPTNGSNESNPDRPTNVGGSNPDQGMSLSFGFYFSRVLSSFILFFEYMMIRTNH